MVLMIDPEMRKDCPMRGNLGNCYPVGGFCMDAVSDEICKAIHNAYDHGFCDALKATKEQEAVKPTWSCGKPFCGACGLRIRGGKFCSECGKPLLWEGR